MTIFYALNLNSQNVFITDLEIIVSLIFFNMFLNFEEIHQGYTGWKRNNIWE